jgi:hypothetical protein
MSVMSHPLVAGPVRRSRVRTKVAAQWGRLRAAAARARLALRRLDTSTVMLIVGILFALVFVYALAVTTLTRRH